MRKSILGLFLLLFTFPATLLLGQGSVAGSITGIVTDPQGSVITSRRRPRNPSRVVSIWWSNYLQASTRSPPAYPASKVFSRTASSSPQASKLRSTLALRWEMQARRSRFPAPSQSLTCRAQTPPPPLTPRSSLTAPAATTPGQCSPKHPASPPAPSTSGATTAINSLPSPSTGARQPNRPMFSMGCPSKRSAAPPPISTSTHIPSPRRRSSPMPLLPRFRPAAPT